jgi:hypothetical protein
MNVSELIQYLQKQPPDMPVAYQCCSELNSLTPELINIEAHQYPRADGWIGRGERDDRATQTYLVLPGN